jgi:hypothetical protein
MHCDTFATPLPSKFFTILPFLTLANPREVGTATILPCGPSSGDCRDNLELIKVRTARIDHRGPIVRRIPTNTNAIFKIGSMTQAAHLHGNHDASGTSIMLVEEGKSEPKDPVSVYLPE